MRDIAAASGIVLVGDGLAQRPFSGSNPGEEREVDGVRLCWCPPGQFIMGSPAGEKDPCRSAFRLRYEPERSSDHIGFRVVAVQL